MTPPAERPDRIVLAARVHPLGGRGPAEALLIRDGRVAALGTEREVRTLARPGAEVESLPGATVTPGLTDAHVHLTAWALGRRRIALHGVTSVEEAVARVAGAGSSGEWVLGQGWNRHLLGGLPTREALDRVVPTRPVLLESNDIHAVWLNTEALRRCGVTRDTPDPAGGQIVRDAQGEPTGVLLEEARKWALQRVPPPGEAEVAEALLDAQRELHSLGLTGVHSVEPTGLRDFQLLHAAGRLRLRVLQHLMLDQLDGAIHVGLRSGFGGEWIRVGGVKMFLDGALGSCTAWMREPYQGSQEDRGIRTLEPEAFRAAVTRAAAAGLASTVHAIGDAAVELALEVLSEVPPPAALRHRVEHLQLCPPDLWDRAARSGVVASMQPVHLLTDIPAAERYWGHQRSRGAYAFAPLRRAGMALAFGSDVPVETPDPRPGLYAAVRRLTWAEYRGADPERCEWYPEHALSRAEALSAYTEGPAFAAGEAERRGRLLPGYDADLVAWDRDPLTCEPEELREMRCLLTVVGGETVHRAGGA